MSETVLYSDGLIELTQDTLVLHGYYFPFGSKRVGLASIEKVVLEKPTLWTGKYRFHGTGDFTTWFAADWGRNRRDMLFILHPGRGWWRMGFSVKDSKAVERLLREKGLRVEKRF